jgi:single-strand DNA-binding protein
MRKDGQNLRRVNYQGITYLWPSNKPNYAAGLIDYLQSLGGVCSLNSAIELTGNSGALYWLESQGVLWVDHDAAGLWQCLSPYDHFLQLRALSMLNEIRLIGRVGKPPKIGNGVAMFSLATTMHWKDAAGVKQDKTQWHNVKAFNGLSDIVSRFVNTGRLVYVSGRLESSAYTDQSGMQKTAFYVVADKVRVLDSQQAQPQQANNSNWQVYQQQQNTQDFQDFDDEIPF